MFTVHCLMYPVYCTLFTVHCTLCPVRCVLYTVYCTLFPVNCTLKYSCLADMTVHSAQPCGHYSGADQHMQGWSRKQELINKLKGKNIKKDSK